jgi:hypothetical protein
MSKCRDFFKSSKVSHRIVENEQVEASVGPMEQARCLECEAPIGGQDHQAVQGVLMALTRDNLSECSLRLSFAEIVTWISSPHYFVPKQASDITKLGRWNSCYCYE